MKESPCKDCDIRNMPYCSENCSILEKAQKLNLKSSIVNPLFNEYTEHGISLFSFEEIIKID